MTKHKQIFKSPGKTSKYITIVLSGLVIVSVLVIKLVSGMDMVQKMHLGVTLVIPVFLMNRLLTRRFGYSITAVCVLLAVFFSGLVDKHVPVYVLIILVQVIVLLLITYLAQEDRRKYEKIKQYSLSLPDPTVQEEHFKMEVVDALLKAIDAKDSYTYNHSKRVASYCRKLALISGLDTDKADKIYLAGMLHDIGKIGMKDSILNKSERLSDMEYIEAKEHVVTGAKIAENMDILKEIVPIILHHHERYDGNGYPEHLKGEDIPVGSRIIAICDSFDAMTSDREYRKGMSAEQAATKLMECIGTQYDPHLCLLFVESIRNNAITVISI